MKIITFVENMKEKIHKIMIFPLVVFIRFYQIFISPLLGTNCRYSPTCSAYALKALHIHGMFYGSWLSVKRIINCNPWGGKGYDPVPEKNKKV
ncbi:MAG: membrane protein insertion efficiency factor YidD [Flavobacteriales bacterium]